MRRGFALFAFGNVALTTFWPLLGVTVLWSASLAPAAPLADALALAAATSNDNKKGFEYGWVRGAGSAAFVVGTISAGLLVGLLGLGVTLTLQACLLLFAALWTREVPNRLVASRTDTENPTVLMLLRCRAFRQVVLVAALVIGSHAMHDGFAAIYWNSTGIGPGVVSILWSEQVVAEVVVFLFVGPAVLSWIGPAWALAVSATIGALRWAISATSTDPYVLACIEPLHGATFALLQLASMRVIAIVVSQGLAATAQTIYGTIGIGAAVTTLTFASGLLYQHLGGRAFWVMSAICVAAIPMALRIQVREVIVHQKLPTA